jgi:hypothetical protein
MLKALIESAVIQNGKVTVPLTVVLVAASGWILWKINSLEAQVEEGIKTLSCFHLQSAEARELADCPGSS